MTLVETEEVVQVCERILEMGIICHRLAFMVFILMTNKSLMRFHPDLGIFRAYELIRAELS